MLQFRVFTKGDPEPFPNGAAPLVGDVKVDGYHGEAIVDGLGLTFCWDDDDKMESLEYLVPNPYAVRALALLKPEMTKAEIIALGAEKVV